jgi:hypothetical protein
MMMFLTLHFTCIFTQVEASRGKGSVNEDWIPPDDIEANAYCRYPEP